MAKQKQLEKDLEHIRSLEPKVTPLVGKVSLQQPVRCRHIYLQVSRVSQLKEQLRGLDEDISVEEGKLAELKTGSQRSYYVVNRELTAAQRGV